MTSKRERRVSVKFAKRQFTSIGLALCLYTIFVLYLPTVLHGFMLVEPAFEFFLNDAYSSVGLHYLIYFIGTFVAFTILKIACKVRVKDFWRKSKIKMKALFNEGIMFCAIGSACLFLVSAINSYIPIGNDVVSPIGMNFAKNYFDNYLYIFIFVIASPIMEEFAFRGILMRALGRFGNRFAIYMTALFYALMHVTVAEMVPAFILSLFLSFVTMHYRSIQPTILIHIAFKALLVFILFLPYEYYTLIGVLLLGIYIYAVSLALLKKYRFAKLKSRKNTRLVYQLFLSRPSVVFTIALVIIHSVLIILLGWNL